MPICQQTLYPAIEPYASGMLRGDDIHNIYWEQCGNPNGVPVLFLHGGPGTGCSVDHRRYFDPAFYRIVLFDQRGAGRSTPLAELKNNSPAHLIADIEKIRAHLNIDKWLVFGGSWGSTLAIAYGEAYPQQCLGFVLRGVFLMRQSEIDWFTRGMRHIFPDVWERFINTIGASNSDNLLQTYYQRLTNPDPEIHMPAAKAFSRFEAEMSTLQPSTKLVDSFTQDAHAIALARLEAHYMLEHVDQVGEKLLTNLPKINHLPAIIVQGRYDICCPPVTAYEVAKAWPKAELIMVADGGHAASEPGILRELVRATEKFKSLLRQT